MTPALLLEQLLNGLITGSIYALLAVGLALTLGVMDLVNTTPGEMYMVGAYAALAAMLSPALLEALFTEIARMPERGTTILLVEQNIRKALEITQRVYVLDYGTNYIDGTPAECLRDRRLAALYLGEVEPVTETSP